MAANPLRSAASRVSRTRSPMRSGWANSMRSACGFAIANAPLPFFRRIGADVAEPPRAIRVAGHALDELRIELPDDGFADAKRPQAGGGHRALRHFGEPRLLEAIDRGDPESAEKDPRGGRVHNTQEEIGRSGQ